MGIFTRKEKYNPDKGKFEVTEKGLSDRIKPKSKTPVYDKLMEQTETRSKKKSGGLFTSYNKKRKHDNEIYQKAYKKGRETAIRKTARKRAKHDIGHSMKYSTRNNYNPWGDLFDMGMTTSKKKKQKGYDPLDNWGLFK